MTRLSAYANLSIAYNVLGYFNKATEYRKLHLSIAKEMKDRGQEGNAYGLLGNDYRRLGDLKKAIHYHKLHLEIAKEVGDRDREGLAYGHLGNDYCELGDLKQAIAYIELSLRIAKELGDRFSEGKGYSCLGRCYFKLRDFQSALYYHEAELRTVKATSDRVGEGRAFYNLGKVYFELGDVKKAIHHHELGLTIAREVGNVSGVGALYCSLGTEYNHLGNFRKAIHFHELQLGIAKKLGDRHGEGGAYSNLGNDFSNLGNYKKAIHYHELHLEISKEIFNRAEEGEAYGNLGNAYSLLADYRKAIYYHEMHLNIVKEAENKLEEERIYGNLGNDYFGVGNLEKAIHYQELSLEIAKEVGDKSSEAQSYTNLGRDYRQLGDLKRAIYYHEFRLEIAKRVGDRAGEGVANVNLGSDHYKLGDYVKAICHYECSLKCAREVGDRNQEAGALDSLGKCYNTLGFVERANNFHKLGLKLAKEVGNRKSEGIAYYNLGYNLEVQGSLNDAVTCYRSSIEALNEVRSRLHFEDEWKISLRNQYQTVYTDLWRVLIRQHKEVEALVAAEQGRAQALKDLMEYSYGLEAPHDDKYSREETVNETLNCLPSNTVFTAVNKREVFLWVIQNGKDVMLRGKENGDSQTSDVNTFIQSLMKTALEKIGVRAGVKCEDRSLDRLRDEVLEADERSNETKCPLNVDCSVFKTLYEIVIEPVADLFHGDELVIVPEGPLWFAPCAAFMDSNSKFLSEFFKIRLIPSLTSLKLITDCQGDCHCKTGALLVGDPWVQEIVSSVGRKLLQLPCAREEVEMIGRILNTAPLTGRDASKNEVLKRLASVALVHIAAHGRMETGEIALAPNPSRETQVPKEADYMLKMSDVLSVKLRARLVVLSCCHSGRGEINAEGVVGIARAFLGAGARSVLVTLWAIDDEATLEFMKIFYHFLLEGRSASEALNRTMKSMRESDDFSEVKYWAPFVLVGDDVTLEFGGGDVIS